MNNHLPHIMHIIDSLSVGGAERMAVDIVNNIDRQAFSVSMCATRRSGSLQRELKQSIPFITLDRRQRQAAGLISNRAYAAITWNPFKYPAAPDN